VKRAMLGLGALVLALAVAVPAGAVERGAGALPELTDGSHIVAQYTLCQGALPDRVITVAVARSKPLNPEHFTFPARTRGSRPALVRALAHALCSLPMMPAGVQACPADWGANYRLQFSLANHRFRASWAPASSAPYRSRRQAVRSLEAWARHDGRCLVPSSSPPWGRPSACDTQLKRHSRARSWCTARRWASVRGGANRSSRAGSTAKQRAGR